MVIWIELIKNLVWRQQISEKKKNKKKKKRYLCSIRKEGQVSALNQGFLGSRMRQVEDLKFFTTVLIQSLPFLS